MAKEEMLEASWEKESDINENISHRPGLIMNMLLVK